MSEEYSITFQKFMQIINNSEPENFIKGLLFCFGAPTIKGIKAATLINFKRDNENLKNIWNSSAPKFLHKTGIEYILLNEFTHSKNALVLIFRRNLIHRAITSPEALNLLNELNYPVPNINKCLEFMQKKFINEFPHEIGIFLDYPPEDVRGFMSDKNNKNYASGYWKVYGADENIIKRAEKIFMQYKRAEYDAAKKILNNLQLV